MSNNFINILVPSFKYTTLLFSILSLILSSCTNRETTNSKVEVRTIIDMNNRSIKIPIQINKVIAHRSGALRLISYLDATEKVIGIEANERKREVPYLYAYPKLKELPIIGSGNIADPELIVALQPDVLICTYLNTGEANDLQKKTGIPVVCLNYGDLNDNKEDFYNALRLLGNILNKDERSEFLINYIEENLNGIKKYCENQKSKERVYIGGIAFRGSHGINSTELKYAPFRYTNTYNLSEVLTRNPNSSYSKLSTFIIDKEQIIEWNPDKIFIDVSGFTLSQTDLDKESVLGKLIPAIQKDEVYFLLPHIWNTINYEHILINTFYIASILHPELYSGFKIKEKANEIYKTFLGKAIYDDLVALYGMGCQKINEDE